MLFYCQSLCKWLQPVSVPFWVIPKAHGCYREMVSMSLVMRIHNPRNGIGSSCCGGDTCGSKVGTLGSDHQGCFQKANGGTRAKRDGGDPADSRGQRGRDEGVGGGNRGSRITILGGWFTYEEDQTEGT